jgi:hypothetical protein
MAAQPLVGGGAADVEGYSAVAADQPSSVTRAEREPREPPPVGAPLQQLPQQCMEALICQNVSGKYT